MPAYDYICSRCGHRVEVVHGIHGYGPTVCPSCAAEGTMNKAFAPPVIHFKGSGWAKKDRSATSTTAKSRSTGGPEAGTAASTAGTDAGTAASTATETKTSADNGHDPATTKSATDGSAGASSD